MATFSGSIVNFSGIKSQAIGADYRKLTFKNCNHDSYRFSKLQSRTALVSRTNQNFPVLYIQLRCSGTTRFSSAGRNYQLNYNDDSHTESFWLNLIRDAIWATRTLFLFLVEQPSQLKYIEWPSFQSTLKTATLTLVLVALLIVALSSVDSALSYLLALLLRRKA
ncbi:hypothetical protein CDL12_25896 [Handroanthus impetiginosus]|uniref:Uncharacterized protein n=1 Tax=Handroanthus impetiginosus TaxID=429701 RepID=A0A2G9G8R6_9LAMI|nr:hypothetical protein CDL12_25896 [Handroanthus impetiginosus]